MEVLSTPQNSRALCTKRTCAIVGDSMISSMKENLLSSNTSIKVRSFPGSTVDNMFIHVTPMLKNDPTT